MAFHPSTSGIGFSCHLGWYGVFFFTFLILACLSSMREMVFLVSKELRRSSFQNHLRCCEVLNKALDYFPEFWFPILAYPWSNGFNENELKYYCVILAEHGPTKDVGRFVTAPVAS